VFHTRGETFDVRDGAAAIAVEPDSAVVTIPDAHFLFTADFKRKGPDLVLTGEDGRKVLVPDYFRHEKQPDLASPEGALLSADLVEILAGPRTPGQYAQDMQAGAPAGPPPIGRVETLTGSASAVRNGVAMELNVGDLIFQGDVDRTLGDVVGPASTMPGRSTARRSAATATATRRARRIRARRLRCR